MRVKISAEMDVSIKNFDTTVDEIVRALHGEDTRTWARNLKGITCNLHGVNHNETL